MARSPSLAPRSWRTSSARMGYTGRLFPVRVETWGQGRERREVEVMRPWSWLKQLARQRRRHGPKVVRDDSE